MRARLLSYAQQLVENRADAEDAVQEVMLKLWNMRERMEEIGNKEAWAIKMTHNVCISLIRRRHPLEDSLDEIEIVTTESSPQRLLEEQESLRLMEALIKELPPVQQTILRMKEIEGYESDEIAQITGCGVEAIRRNLSRARSRVCERYRQIMQENRRNVK